MATKDEMTILTALAKKGYYPTLAAWVGGERGWVISYKFSERDKEHATFNARSRNDAERQIADMPQNTG